MSENPSPTGLGLIGCGAFGEFCADAYRQLPAAKLVAVADSRQAAAQKLGEAQGVFHTTDAQELIAHPQVQVVHVATPPSSHHELVLAAARAGKHVLCEKPLAMNAAEADEMLAAIGEKDLICPVNFVMRYNQATDAVKAVIDSGVLGKVIDGRLTNCATDTHLGPDHWFWNREVSGGIFVEHGVHFFDLYRYWLGDGQVIDAHVRDRENTRQQDRVQCTIWHESGPTVHHAHGFDQIEWMDRTDHRLVCELGDLRVFGWIPLTVEIDAAVDEAAAEKLAELLPGAAVETVEEYPPARQDVLGRGKGRHVTRRIRVQYTPNADKGAVYADSVRLLLSDQLQKVRDPGHTRRVEEANGREAVALAARAAELAQKGR